MRLLVPLPSTDFDTTEVCLPWREARRCGLEVVFATPDGRPAACDPLLLTGVIFGLLGASRAVIQVYGELQRDPAFRAPLAYSEVVPQQFDALMLPGGHAKGMRAYLESSEVQGAARHFLEADKPVGAICHGPIVLARTLSLRTGQSILRGRRATALPWILEHLAYLLTAWKLGDYYRTYPVYVQAEMVEALGDRDQFRVGNPLWPTVVEDGNLLTARWPLDAGLFARRLMEKIKNVKEAPRWPPAFVP